MLEQVSPEQYASLNANLPAASMEKLWLVDWICQAQIAWQESLLRKYPHLTQNSRAVHRNAGSQSSISFETYIRGELMTHSVNTLRLYAHQTEKAQKAGKNLCGNILENVVQQLGYASLEAADNGIA